MTALVREVCVIIHILLSDGRNLWESLPKTTLWVCSWVTAHCLNYDAVLCPETIWCFSLFLCVYVFYHSRIGKQLFTFFPSLTAGSQFAPTLLCSTLLFISSSSSFRFSSLIAAEDAAGPVLALMLLLEFLAAWFKLQVSKEKPERQMRPGGWWHSKIRKQRV